jgi:hypothetical protein
MRKIMRGIKLLLLLGLSGIFMPSCDKLNVWEKVNGPDGFFLLSVVSTSPSAGETSVPVNTGIAVTFDDNVEDATLPGNFTVQNGGVVAGAYAHDHVTKIVIFTPGGSLLPGTAYTVVLTPGIKNAAGEGLDSDYSFSFTTATAFEPEFDLFQGGTPIAVGDTYDFGTTTVGAPPRDIVFTITNPGTGPLNLTGAPFVQVAPPAFSIFLQPSSPVAPAGNTTFTVRFETLMAGAKAGVVIIPNDDATENSYTFTVIGTVLPLGIIAPEINVKQDTTDFPSGTEYNFGTVEVGSSSVPVPFTIENLGNDNLTVNSIDLGGQVPGMYSLGGLPGFPAVVPPGVTITFTVTFSPTANGTKKAEVHIENDDSNENPYIIKLRGRGN